MIAFSWNNKQCHCVPTLDWWLFLVSHFKFERNAQVQSASEAQWRKFPQTNSGAQAIVICSHKPTSTHYSHCLSKVFQFYLFSQFYCNSKLDICVSRKHGINKDGKRARRGGAEQASERRSVDNSSPAATNGTCEASFVQFKNATNGYLLRDIFALQLVGSNLHSRVAARRHSHSHFFDAFRTWCYAREFLVLNSHQTEISLFCYHY